MRKEQALQALVEACKDADEAERSASNKQAVKRERVRAAFSAGCTGPEVASVLGSSVQWAYQMRKKSD